MFPYKKIRAGQIDFLEDVRTTIKNGEHIIAHAPTGIGKTVAVLTPSIERAMSKGNTIFFLTPKHTQHMIVIDTLSAINKKIGKKIIVVDIIGKQWMCPHRVKELRSREFNEFCRALKKEERCEYYNRAHSKKDVAKVRHVVKAIKSTPLHNEKILSLCGKWGLCPYEICIRVGADANVIVCDYFHLFSPNVRDAFMKKLRKDIEGAIVIADEAHNLPGRIRKLLSVNLTDYTVSQAAKEANVLGYPNLEDDFRSIQEVLKGLGNKLKKNEEKRVLREDFSAPLAEKTSMSTDKLTASINDLGEEILSIPNRYRSYAKAVAKFLKEWEGEDYGFVRILFKDKGIGLSYRCLDPSVSASEVFSATHSSILMSGTLLPLHMYTDILGLATERTKEMSYISPFPRENRVTLIVPKVTTKFSKRSSQMYRNYAQHIRRIVVEVPGNIAVFFPAYHILDSIVRELSLKRLSKEMIIEEKGMGKSDRKRLYDQLTRSGNSLLLGVQAGSFSEGVDYPENLLDAVVVVGLPLEKPNLELTALIDYYQFKFERGWDYGYIFPAMNRSLQAAGRCIRSETDRGAIILMDERFRWRNYAKCLPEDFEFIVTETPENYLRKFFDR